MDYLFCLALGVMLAVSTMFVTVDSIEFNRISSICTKNGGLEKLIVPQTDVVRIYCKDGANFLLEDEGNNNEQN